VAFRENIAELVEIHATGTNSKHDSWVRIELKKIANVINGFAFKSSLFNTSGEGVPLIRIRDILKGSTSTHYTGDIPEGYWVNEGDILVGMDGDFNTCRWNAGASLLNQRVCKIEGISSNLFNEQFLFYLLPGYLKLINEHTSATTVKHLSSKTLGDLPLPLPPLNEQTRIANKLDSLLAKVDSAQTRLERIPTLLKRFRQSVLAAATSGELTREWREEMDISQQTWISHTLGGVSEVKTGSTPLKSNRLYYDNGDIPWLTSTVTGDKYVSEAQSFITEIAVKECRLKIFTPGTLLIAMYGEGKTRGQVTEIGISAAINQACAAVIVDENVAMKDFVKLCISANYERTRLLAEGGAQPNLNLSKVRSIPVSLPSRDEQKEIVRRVDSLFAMADTVEKQYHDAKKRIDRLTQSILSKAFRGELVSQDPNDEPASELLKRIQAEREQQQAKPKRKTSTRKRKTTTKKKKLMKLAEAPETYLLDLLTQLGGEAQAETLWKQSEFSIEDFYAKLKQEMATKKIIDFNPSSDPSLRKLKVA